VKPSGFTSPKASGVIKSQSRTASLMVVGMMELVPAGASTPWQAERIADNDYFAVADYFAVKR
jgi:hypothetical protein